MDEGDEDDKEKETLEWTTSASANQSVVGGSWAVGPAVVVGWSLARLGMGLTGRLLK